MLASPPPPPPISAPSLTSRLQTFSGIVVALLPTHSAAHRGFGEAAVALPPTHSAAHRASSHDHPSKAGEPPPPLFPSPHPVLPNLGSYFIGLPDFGIISNQFYLCALFWPRFPRISQVVVPE